MLIKENFNITLYGFSGIAINKNWKETGFSLMDRMWKQVSEFKLKNKGMNVWVYENGDAMFAGVELMETPPATTDLEEKQVKLGRYVSYKHIGPYQKIPEAGTRFSEDLRRQGLQPVLPYIEIYGHWNPDESKLETDLLWSLE